jgi:hypothetical protein
VHIFPEGSPGFIPDVCVALKELIESIAIKVVLNFFDETGGGAPTDYILKNKSNQKQYSRSRNKKSKVKNKKITHKLLAMKT